MSWCLRFKCLYSTEILMISSTEREPLHRFHILFELCRLVIAMLFAPTEKWITTKYERLKRVHFWGSTQGTCKYISTLYYWKNIKTLQLYSCFFESNVCVKFSLKRLSLDLPYACVWDFGRKRDNYLTLIMLNVYNLKIFKKIQKVGNFGVVCIRDLDGKIRTAGTRVVSQSESNI